MQPPSPQKHAAKTRPESFLELLTPGRGWEPFWAEARDTGLVVLKVRTFSAVGLITRLDEVLTISLSILYPLKIFSRPRRMRTRS